MEALLQFNDEPFVPMAQRRRKAQGRADWRWRQKPKRIAEAIRKATQRVDEIFDRHMDVNFVRGDDYAHLLDKQTLDLLGSELVKATDPETGETLFTPEQDLGFYVVTHGPKSERAAAVVRAKRFQHDIIQQLGPTKISVLLTRESDYQSNHPGIGQDDIFIVFRMDQFADVLLRQRDVEAFLPILRQDRKAYPDVEFSLLDIYVMFLRGQEAKRNALFNAFYDQICEAYPWPAAPWTHPFWGPFHFDDNQPQSYEESDMPLNNQDKKDIAEIVAKKLNDYTFSFDKISYDNKHIMAIIAAAILIGGALLTGLLFVNNSINGLREDLHSQNSNMTEQISVLKNTVTERLPTRPIALTSPITSTNNGLSTPPTTTSGSPNP